MRIEEGWHTNSHQPTYDYLIPTTLTVQVPPGWSEARVEYPVGATKKFSFAEEPLSVYDGVLDVPILIDVPAEAARGAVPITAALRYQACDDRTCLPPVTTEATVELTVGEGSGAAVAPPAAAAETGASSEAPRRGLVWMLMLAFFGGLILNAMPCVLPVLSLKVFGLVQRRGRGTRRRRARRARHGGRHPGLVLGPGPGRVAARSAGAAVGWGVQFQEPALRRLPGRGRGALLPQPLGPFRESRCRGALARLAAMPDREKAPPATSPPASSRR